MRKDNKLRFAAVGLINTSIDIVVYTTLVLVGLNIFLANILSTSLGMIVGFLLHRSYTFATKGSARRQITPFLIVTICGLWIIQPAIIWGFHLLAPSSAPIAVITAKLFAILAGMVWNYFWYSRVIFRNKES